MTSASVPLSIRKARVVGSNIYMLGHPMIKCTRVSSHFPQRAQEVQSSFVNHALHPRACSTPPGASASKPLPHELYRRSWKITLFSSTYTACTDFHFADLYHSASSTCCTRVVGPRQSDTCPLMQVKRLESRTCGDVQPTTSAPLWHDWCRRHAPRSGGPYMCLGGQVVCPRIGSSPLPPVPQNSTNQVASGCSPVGSAFPPQEPTCQHPSGTF